MRREILHLLDEQNFVSGELLAKKLGVSRTAIWKQIKVLQNLGYEIESVRNRGYRLVSRPDIPLSEEISADLNTNIIGKNVVYFETIDSTNSYGKKLVNENAADGTVIVADIQTSGRGRKNRSWLSHSGGLWFSIILYPNIPPQNGMLVTMAISVSIAQAIKETIGIEPIIKWPNDLIINGKKVCGVLTEIDAEMDRINYSVVGVGINVNNEINDEIKDIATSLSLENKSRVSRVDLLRNILKKFDENYQYLTSDNHKIIRDLWHSFSDIIGKKIQVAGEKEIFEGVVSDIDDSGCLILETDVGKVRVITGDIIVL